MKKFLFILLALFFWAQPVFAEGNNQFGIHITQTEDLGRAVELVNSSGGDWGYVTVVIQENDKNQEKWQKLFDLCREKHLIPLVRLATKLKGDVWEKPNLESIAAWANFLSGLNWPAKNRYVIVFNEPNHAKEWRGKVDPGEYALILDQAISIFKEKNPDFLILNAGFDQAAPDSKETMDELRFLKMVNAQIPGIFSRLDGWASHSYPNHGFIGKPWEVGRATIKGYEWELQILKNNFGVTSDLPVFITETGWPHTQGLKKTKGEKFYDQLTAAEYTKLAFENVWLNDEKVVAVTPFILNYPFYPFANFSWLDSQGLPYPQYEVVKDLKKVKGEPTQIQRFEVVNFPLPSFLPANLALKGKISLKNTGQSIWGEKHFKIESLSEGFKLTDLTLPEGILVKPGEKAEFEFLLEVPKEAGKYVVAWQDLPKHELQVFEVWKLTNQKDSFFNRIFRRILNFRYLW